MRERRAPLAPNHPQAAPAPAYCARVTSRLQALHLSAATGRRFALLHEPDIAPCGLVLHVHAFAEEMNKARRMVALQARALAQDGLAVLVPDLYGCGDSDGDFGDATWAHWLDDTVAAAAWLRARHPAAAGELWLWGLRAGALLASQAAAQLPQPAHLLLWQPASAGKPPLQQFLRLKMAAELQGGGKGITEALKRELAQERSVEVAGYTLHPALASGLENAVLAPPAPGMRTRWLEVAAEADAALLPASERTLAAWREKGLQPQSEVVGGPAFWQTSEIEDAPNLVGATCRALRQVAPALHVAASTLA